MTARLIGSGYHSVRGWQFDSVRTGRQGEMGGKMEKESLLSNQCWLLAFPKALNRASAHAAHLACLHTGAYCPPGSFF